MYFDLNYVIEQVGKEKGIPKAIIIDALEEAVLPHPKRSSETIWSWRPVTTRRLERSRSSGSRLWPNR